MDMLIFMFALDGVVADPESTEFCEALVKALENHPSISLIICEVVALLARTGITRLMHRCTCTNTALMY